MIKVYVKFRAGWQFESQRRFVSKAEAKRWWYQAEPLGFDHRLIEFVEFDEERVKRGDAIQEEGRDRQQAGA